MTHMDRWATPGLVERLTELWLRGWSASQIAVELNAGFTRNAIIGKVHRLGITARATPARPAIKHATRPHIASHKPKALKTPLPPRQPPPAFVAPSQAEGMAIGDLRHFHCRHPINSWPKGYGEHARFCGKFAAVAPYCPDHAAMNLGGKPEPRSNIVKVYDRRAA